jgi:hypothetical protein
METGDREQGRRAIEESIETARALGWTWWVGRCLTDLAVDALNVGDHEEAERHGREFLDIAWTASNRQDMLSALAVLARAAALRGDDERALALWASVDAIEDAPGRFGRFDREAYAAAMPEGVLPAPLALDEAVALALAS